MKNIKAFENINDDISSDVRYYTDAFRKYIKNKKVISQEFLPAVGDKKLNPILHFENGCKILAAATSSSSSSLATTGLGQMEVRFGKFTCSELHIW